MKSYCHQIDGPTHSICRVCGEWKDTTADEYNSICAECVQWANDRYEELEKEQKQE